MEVAVRWLWGWLGAFAALAAGPAAADGGRALVDMLDSGAPPTDACQQQARVATRARLLRTDLPDSGKVVVVNIPAGTLTAYYDGEPQLEMDAVVGRPRTPTPELRTAIDHVRLNPTWTVPASILREPQWRERAADPSFLARNGFSADGSGLVQAPGPNNALGTVKFALRGAGDIYLHDTNDPDAFDEDGRALSHGCVRVGDPMALAAWVLGMDEGAARSLLAKGDTADRRPSAPVTVILGYFTAWPDANGVVRYYPDVYGKDGDACRRR